MQLQSPSLITAIDELTARGYRVRHDGVVADFWLISKPRKQGGYNRPETLTASAVIALSEGRFSL